MTNTEYVSKSGLLFSFDWNYSHDDSEWNIHFTLIEKI